jgi:hypothetical protein
VFGVKLTAAAASAGDPAGVPGQTVPICPGQVQRRVPAVVNVTAHGRRERRAGQRAGVEDGRERLVAEPGRDRDLTEVEVRQLQH